MQKVSLQFHALPTEVLAILGEVLVSVPCKVTALHRSPFSAHSVESVDALDSGKVDVLALSLNQTKLDASSFMAFLDKNPSVLILQFGHLTNRGIRESWLAAKTDDREALKCWKKIVRSFHEHTISGEVVAENPTSGARTQLNDHRYTVGARDEYLQSIPILPAAGNAIIRLGNCLPVK